MPPNVCSPPTALRLLEDTVDLREGDVVVQNGANSAVGQVSAKLRLLILHHLLRLYLHFLYSAESQCESGCLTTIERSVTASNLAISKHTATPHTSAKVMPFKWEHHERSGIRLEGSFCFAARSGDSQRSDVVVQYW